MQIFGGNVPGPLFNKVRVKHDPMEPDSELIESGAFTMFDNPFSKPKAPPEGVQSSLAGAADDLFNKLISIIQ